jgi:hypothetical protein
MSRMSNRFLSAHLVGFVMGTWVVVPLIFSPTLFAQGIITGSLTGLPKTSLARL